MRERIEIELSSKQLFNIVAQYKVLFYGYKYCHRLLCVVDVEKYVGLHWRFVLNYYPDTCGITLDVFGKAENGEEFFLESYMGYTESSEILTQDEFDNFLNEISI